MKMKKNRVQGVLEMFYGEDVDRVEVLKCQKRTVIARFHKGKGYVDMKYHWNKENDSLDFVDVIKKVNVA